MPGPFNFDAFLGWVNITDPNNVPQDARVVGADDLLRFENLGLDTKEKFAEVDEALANLDSDTVVAASLAVPTSATRAAVSGMVDDGVEEFQAVIDAVPGQVQAQVPPLVSTALAADSTVANAAATAVAGQVTAANLVRGDDVRIPDSDTIPGLAFAAIDSRGQRTRLEANDVDGGPTELSLSLDGPALKEYMGFIDGEDPRIPSSQAVDGISFATVDASGKALWIQANDTDGGLTPFATEMVAKALGITLSSVITTYIADGDSITQGGHGGGTPLNWPAQLGTLLGKTVINRGRSGSTGVEAALRQGGLTPIVTVTNGILPANGTAVPVTLVYPTATDGAFSGGATHGARTYDGTFDGIAVQLTENVDDTWTIKRSTIGTEDYRTTPRTAVIIDGLEPAATRIFWPGRNDYPKTNVLSNIDKMAKWTTDNGGRFLVLSILTRSGIGEADADNVEVRAVNEQMQLKYPRNYVNIRDWLVRYGVEAAGLVPTQADLDATAIGGIPPSLMADSLHPNASGRIAIAKYLHQQLVARNWA